MFQGQALITRARFPQGGGLSARYATFHVSTTPYTLQNASIALRRGVRMPDPLRATAVWTAP